MENAYETEVHRRPLRIGIAGLGRAGLLNHLPALRQLPGLYTIAAVCDLMKERRDIVERDFPNVRTYRRIEDMLDDPEIDVIDIALPTLDHAKVAIAALNRNIWTVVIIHSLDDFVLLFITSGLSGTPLTTDYVQTGDNGIAILLVYCITCAIYLPFIFIGKRLIDEVGPWRGDFYHYGEAKQTASAPIATAVAPLPGNIPVTEAVYPAHSQNIYQAPYPQANPKENENTAADDAATAKALRGKHAAISRTEHTEGIDHGQGV